MTDDTQTSDDHYRLRTEAALAEGDWHQAYRWAKGWIGSGGGARSVEPWLVYVASALQHAEPRTAVHSADLALRHWIAGETGRAVLHYARGEVIRRHLRDPKTAQDDLDLAARAPPNWLRATAAEAQATCRSEAAASGKRKPSVRPAPAYEGTIAPTAAPADSHLRRQPPALWPTFSAVLTAQGQKQTSDANR